MPEKGTPSQPEQSLFHKSCSDSGLTHEPQSSRMRPESGTPSHPQQPPPPAAHASENSCGSEQPLPTSPRTGPAGGTPSTGRPVSGSISASGDGSPTRVCMRGSLLPKHTSSSRPEFGTPSQPRQVELSPKQTPQASASGGTSTLASSAASASASSSNCPVQRPHPSGRKPPWRGSGSKRSSRDTGSTKRQPMQVELSPPQTPQVSRGLDTLRQR